MIVIPPDVLAQFESTLTKKSVPNQLRNYYKKWLWYYLDFCQKYSHPPSTKESLQEFIRLRKRPRLRAVTPAYMKRFGGGRHFGVQARVCP